MIVDAKWPIGTAPKWRGRPPGAPILCPTPGAPWGYPWSRIGTPCRRPPAPTRPGRTALAVRPPHPAVQFVLPRRRPPNALPIARIPKRAWGPCSPFARSPAPPSASAASDPWSHIVTPRSRPPAPTRPGRTALAVRPPHPAVQFALPRRRPPNALPIARIPKRAWGPCSPFARSHAPSVANATVPSLRNGGVRCR